MDNRGACRYLWRVRQNISGTLPVIRESAKYGSAESGASSCPGAAPAERPVGQGQIDHDDRRTATRATRELRLRQRSEGVRNNERIRGEVRQPDSHPLDDSKTVKISSPGFRAMFILEEEDRNLFIRVQEQNLKRQYDLLTNCIEIGLMKGPASFDKFLLWALNPVAVANISQFGGRFRREPIYVGDHKPPHFNEVSDWMDRFVSTIQENWYIWTETELAAYGLWRLNWIHPFIEGNGRTARAASYFLLCVRSGYLLPGSKIVPERIRENRAGYEAALTAADRAWDAGHLDFRMMENYLADLLEAQLSGAVEGA